MAILKTFSPVSLTLAAQESGFYQCKKCGLVWIGKDDVADCPEGVHGRPVRVAVLCRTCDAPLPQAEIAAHMASDDHKGRVARYAVEVIWTDRGPQRRRLS